MKKLIATITAMAFAVATVAALELPNGINAQVTKTKEVNGHIIEAQLVTSVNIPTKYGTFATKPNTEITFYESGAVKGFHIGEDVEVTIKAGTFLITSSEERPGVSKNRPITLYESGNLQSAYLPTVPYKKNAPKKNIAKTSIGSIEARQKAPISFFPDGSIESLYVGSKEIIDYQGKKQELAANSKIVFYTNGSLREFAPATSQEYYGTPSKAKKPVGIGQNGQVISFIPADNASIELGGYTYFYGKDAPFEVYESGTLKSACLNFSEKDGSFGGLQVFCSTKPETLQDKAKTAVGTGSAISPFARNDVQTAAKNIAFSFYEGNKLASAECTGDFIFLFAKDTYLSARRIEKYENGMYRKITLGQTLSVVADEANTWYEFSTLYFSPDAKTVARIGTEHFKSPKGSFFDTIRFVICLMDGEKITQKIYDEKLTGNSEIIMDDNGKPTAYTARKSLVDDEMTEYPIGK